MDQNYIKSIIPHREPFLFVDRIETIEEDRVVAVKEVKADEYFFKGHFPDYPVMPGVLIVEALAQAGGVLLLRDKGDKIPLFLGIDRARFKRGVRPGDVLRLEVSVMKKRGDIVWLKGEAKAGGELVCQVEILAGAFPRGSEEKS
ncbi:MAG TPA: beta-hydroxyacyl-ACP dehydratase [bacterium (Candidatus Stahlbacteria)]|nr:beta-hydroxyacyl-ACP dehydratase [Candidatus Stahlbacteria bacterium]